MRFSAIVLYLFALFFATVYAAPIPTEHQLERRIKFSIGDVVGVAAKDLSKDPLAGKGTAATKAIIHPAIVTDIDAAGKAILAPISHTASAVSADVKKLAPSTNSGSGTLSGFVHVGDEISADASAIKGFAGGKLKASAADVQAIKDEITKNTTPTTRRSAEPEAHQLESRAKFSIGDVVGVAVKDLSKDPIPGKGNAATKAITHPAIVTDIDAAGNAIVAPVSHTASSISSDVSKLASSSGLTGFVHVGDTISADASAIKKFAGGKLKASASDVQAIKDEIAKNIP